MRLKKENFSKVAQLLLNALDQSKQVHYTQGRDHAQAIILKVLEDDRTTEEKIEAETEKLLAQYTKQAGANLDMEKMRGMIRKELIKKHKFVL